jgi:hypothetical protein
MVGIDKQFPRTRREHWEQEQDGAVFSHGLLYVDGKPFFLWIARKSQLHGEPDMVRTTVFWIASKSVERCLLCVERGVPDAIVERALSHLPGECFQEPVKDDDQHEDEDVDSGGFTLRIVNSTSAKRPSCGACGQTTFHSSSKRGRRGRSSSAD